jgi:hypothetical protein
VKIMSFLFLAGLVAAGLLAKEETWGGKISDSMCGPNHNSAAEHSGQKMSDHDCVLACVKEHQAKYVFIHDGKVYNIANQDAAGLEEHAGHTVEMKGDVNGDTITVANIAMK